MKIPLLLLTFVFFISALVMTQTSGTSLDPVRYYTESILRFITGHFLIIIIGWFFLSVITLWQSTFTKHVSFFRKLAESMLTVALAAIISVYFSLLLVFVIAVIELNIFSVVFRINPGFLGISTNRQQIAEILRQSVVNPDIVATDPDGRKILSSIAAAAAGKDSFYARSVISSIPGFLILPAPANRSSLYLIDRTLIISQLNRAEIESVSPYIGYHMVKKYFPGRAVKSYPTIKILSREEYVRFRIDDEDRKIRKVEEQMTLLFRQSSSLSATIAVDKNQLLEASEAAELYKSQKESRYSVCLNQGVYIGGRFQKSNTKEECESVVKDMTEAISNEVQKEKQLIEKIKKDESLLSEYENAKKIFETQAKVITNSRQNIPHELGVFLPPDTIRLAIDSASADTLIDFLGTLTHEYLHYASYASEEVHFQDHFFEEGLTEYFARQIIEYDFQKDTNLGYPVFVKIMTQVMEIIPETELSDIYFSKDQAGLETVLNRVYGDDFYQQNRVLFATLPFASDEKQVLKIANVIMKKINGKPLTIKDLRSTSINL